MFIYVTFKFTRSKAIVSITTHITSQKEVKRYTRCTVAQMY